MSGSGEEVHSDVSTEKYVTSEFAIFLNFLFFYESLCNSIGYTTSSYC